MGFWSALTFARSAPPPVVTAAELGRFVRSLAETDALEDAGGLAFQARYGSRIDADDRPAEIVEWDDSETVGTVKDYPWDVSISYPSLTALADDLATDTRAVYRGCVSLGNLRAEPVEAVSREPSEQNKLPLCLHTVSFSLGPILSAGLDSESPAFVGWMGLSLSGPGYFYPWTYRQARSRVETVDAISRITTACRKAWPVRPTPPSTETIVNRRRMENLRLYDEIDRPADWLWFVNES